MKKVRVFGLIILFAVSLTAVLFGMGSFEQEPLSAYESERALSSGSDALTLDSATTVKIWNDIEPAALQGMGSVYDPFLIGSAEELATLAWYINNADSLDTDYDFDYADVKLTADIDLKNIQWIPIGNYQNQCNIRLDGGFHKIKNLTIKTLAFDTSNDYHGLFGYCSGGSVSNFGIEGGEINTYARYSGAVVGYGYDLTVSGCFSDINVTNKYTGGYSGGIAGGINCSYGPKVLLNCTNSGSVIATNAGGIVGSIISRGGRILKEIGSVYDDLSIANCMSAGSVAGVSNAGGIGGTATAVSFINCINVGAVTGQEYASIGGITGQFSFRAGDEYIKPAYILGCKAAGSLNADSVLYAGGLVGRLKADSTKNISLRFEKNYYKQASGLLGIGNEADLTEELAAVIVGDAPIASSDEIFTGVFAFDSEEYYNDTKYWAVAQGASIFDIGIEWAVSERTLPTLKKVEYWIDHYSASFAGGSGTEDDPYLIGTAAQLARIAHLTNSLPNSFSANYNDCFKLVSDIDLAGKAWTGIGCEFRIGGIVGYYKYFGGNFDGDGFTIKNMRARDKSWVEEADQEGAYYTFYSDAALFSAIGYNSIGSMTLSNFALDNAHCIGKNAGGVVAYMHNFRDDNTIQNIDVDGIICGEEYAGGIIAEIRASSSMFFLIEGCAVDGIVSGKYAGGIIGRVYKDNYQEGYESRIELNANVNKADVLSYQHGVFQNPAAAGGIVGAAQLEHVTIKNCINVGNIKAYGYYSGAGGILGARSESRNAHEMKIIVSCCKNAGQVFGAPSDYSTAGAMLGNFGADPNLTETISITLNYSIYLAGTAAYQTSDSAFMVVTERHNIATNDSPGEGDLAFSDIEYFFNLRYFTFLGNLANRLYYVFNGKYITHTVTFLDDDDTVIAVREVYHRMSAIAPPAPTKDSTDEYDYEFIGWDKEFSSITEDVSVKAMYYEIERIYSYSFYDEYGVAIKSVTASYGDVIIPPDAPYKHDTAKYTYPFAGWTGYETGMTVSERHEFFASYTETIRQYTYTFYNDNGTVLKKETADYGTVIVAPENPTKQSDGRFEYSFNYWVDNNWTMYFYDGFQLTEDIAFWAQYNSQLRLYEVTFMVDGVQYGETQLIPYGDRADRPTAPKKASTAQYDYMFIGWGGDITRVTDDITVNAVFAGQLRKYTVQYMDDTECIQAATQKYGEEILTSFVPEKDGYTFVGWLDGDGKAFTSGTVSGDVLLYASFTEKSKDEGCNSGVDGNSLLVFIFLFSSFLCLTRRANVRYT